MTLAHPTIGALLTQWSPQPVAILALVAASGWYLARARVRAQGWSAWRSLTFAVAVVATAWVTNGFAQAYGRSSFWVWTAQTLALMLVVPPLLLAGRPVQLADGRGLLPRVVGSGLGRTLANPLVGPALVPLVAMLLFFGPVPGFVAQYPAAGWVLQLLVVLVGLGICLPLVADGAPDAGSLAVGLALAVGVVELLVDAVPGIVLRLYTTAASSFWDHRLVHSWSASPLHDQQTAGAILWAVAEVLDVPFLVLVFRRWVRADALEAARVDSVLEAERVVHDAHTETTATVDQPWWLSDPTMKDRFGSGPSR